MTILAAEQSKDWTALKVLLGECLEPWCSEDNPCSYGCLGRGLDQHRLFVQA